MKSKVFIIAEAGVNHNGDMSMAKKLVELAKASGADAVKFQSFITDQIVTETSEVAAYQKVNTPSKKSQWDLLKDLELSFPQQLELRDYCKKLGIEFMSTSFDLLSLEFLVDKAEVKRLKVPSGEITNAQLLLAAGRTGLPLILSTGMSTLQEVENALDVMCYGRSTSTAPKSFDAMCGFYRSAAAVRYRANISVLHCVSQYPAPDDDLNLNAMRSLAQSFPEAEIGYSDHSLGILASIAAVALGATVIEKHFTLDKQLPGPDHRASLDADELSQMIAGIRQVEKMLGSAEKRPAASEKDSLLKVRRSLVALEPIGEGETFTERNLGVRRVQGGDSPLFFFDLLGKKAEKSFKKWEPVNFGRSEKSK